ncbi:alpha/beta fold hydrolase [Holophaga foetida]|uniref:alpha/beta fold hydrolase n=1 Tax=Holophaga foetida TaxID=35839 RepID=UPI0002472AF1|nr:alpha/beta fold hydrolase [Holophaga foetida]
MIKFFSKFATLPILAALLLGSICQAKAADTRKENPVTPQTYVLIPGAWHSGWFWNRVKPLLEAKGNKVITVDLPGHGDNAIPISGQNIDSYAEFVSKLIDEQSEPVILVGHSMAGAVVCRTSEINPKKVKKMVVLCGFLLQNGQSMNGMTDGLQPTDWMKLSDIGFVSLSRDQKVSFVNPKIARSIFYGSLTDEQAGIAILHLGGESIAAQIQPINLGSNFASVPKFYIKTLNDHILLPEFQEKMIKNSSLEKVYTINSDHSPFLSAPKELADILLDIAAHKH